MSTIIDINKPIWKVKGKLHDRHVYTVFVNATDSNHARKLAEAEGMVDFDCAWEIDPKTGCKLLEKS